MKAAVPHYMQDMQQAAAGHRFSLYFPIFSEKWEVETNKKGDELGKVSLQKDDERRTESLRERQQAQALQLANAVFSLPAISTAPFVTGMGYEHPVENGFAFLNPYGVPYLAGSSVKGVLRCAARELDLPKEEISELFGSAAEKGKQGALNFWDVFPKGQLTVEIMTPHHSEYFKSGSTTTPHDSETPIPIPFLSIAEGASFSFHVQLIREVDCDWQVKLQACFEHAFEWLGFGAKTSVGYGAMEEDLQAIADMENVKEKAIEEKRLSVLTPFEKELEKILTYPDNSVGDLMKGLEAGEWQKGEKRIAAQHVKELLQKQKSWLESFSGKNKQKKKKHERTLKVMRFLS
ncbi:MAG: type III-B CRISPR module RAMP protein Cmr6 [Mariprofundaceae bacterium]|nr:type III-B CRISPR module RAMP protein Cmr6 [Mariprofundaceae bacterium]